MVYNQLIEMGGPRYSSKERDVRELLQKQMKTLIEQYTEWSLKIPFLIQGNINAQKAALSNLQKESIQKEKEISEFLKSTEFTSESFSEITKTVGKIFASKQKVIIPNNHLMI